MYLQRYIDRSDGAFAYLQRYTNRSAAAFSNRFSSPDAAERILKCAGAAGSRSRCVSDGPTPADRSARPILTSQRSALAAAGRSGRTAALGASGTILFIRRNPRRRSNSRLRTRSRSPRGGPRSERRGRSFSFVKTPDGARARDLRTRSRSPRKMERSRGQQSADRLEGEADEAQMLQPTDRRDAIRVRGPRGQRVSDREEGGTEHGHPDRRPPIAAREQVGAGGLLGRRAVGAARRRRRGRSPSGSCARRAPPTRPSAITIAESTSSPPSSARSIAGQTNASARPWVVRLGRSSAVRIPVGTTMTTNATAPAAMPQASTRSSGTSLTRRHPLIVQEFDE